jgi:Holliday junction resolvasome RuvABC endonuclease subunit
MRVVGLDLSLTATGVCLPTGSFAVATSKTTGMARLDGLRNRILEWVTDAELVMIEGYSMGAPRSSHSHAAGELGGLIRWSLWTDRIAYLDVPPALLKKFATGKGNANKDAMVATAARLGCPADDNNAVDAWWLRELGLYSMDGGAACQRLASLPDTAYRDEAITKLAPAVIR